jgi:hypothetical protein
VSGILREETYRIIQEYTRLCAGTGDYNRREDTTNYADHGEIQTRNSGFKREVNSKHTSKSMGEERERGHFAHREYSVGG